MPTPATIGLRDDERHLEACGDQGLECGDGGLRGPEERNPMGT